MSCCRAYTGSRAMWQEASAVTPPGWEVSETVAKTNDEVALPDYAVRHLRLAAAILATVGSENYRAADARRLARIIGQLCDRIDQPQAPDESLAPVVFDDGDGAR